MPALRRVAVFAADTLLERGVAAGVLYVAVVVFSAWIPGMRSTLGYPPRLCRDPERGTIGPRRWAQLVGFEPMGAGDFDTWRA